MDRSTSEAKGPQGDTQAIRNVLDIIKDMEPGMTPIDQIKCLKRIVLTVDMVCPISGLGVKKMMEHIDELDSKYFSPKAIVEYNDLHQRRAIKLIGRSQGDREKRVGIYMRHEGGLWRRSLSLYLTEKGSLIAMEAFSEVCGEDVLPASRITISKADEPTLVEFMEAPSASSESGNKHLVINALGGIAYALWSAQDKALKKAAEIGWGRNAVNMMTEKLKERLDTTTLVPPPEDVGKYAGRPPTIELS